MTFVALLGILISLAAVPFAFPGRTNDRYALAFLLFFAHVGASIAYFTYIQTHDADTALYYFDSYRFAQKHTVLGTIFTIQLVQNLRKLIGGSYLDYFILFQSIGMWGVVLVTRVAEELRQDSLIIYDKKTVLLMFLPSMNFWTSAIGKDAPLFFASSLAAWSIMKLSSRWVGLALALSVMVLFRPHIAFIVVVSMGLALFLESKYDVLPRLLFLVMSGVGSIFIIRAVSGSIGVDPTDPTSISKFVSSQQVAGSSIAGTTAVHGNFLVKLISLLFRPFFIDAHGLFGIISSVENVMFLFGAIAMIQCRKYMVMFFSSGLFAKYCFFFTAVLTFSLTSVYYNVGLGLRERVMIYPTLIPFILIAWSISAALRQQSDAQRMALRAHPNGQLPQHGPPERPFRSAPPSAH